MRGHGTGFQRKDNGFLGANVWGAWENKVVPTERAERAPPQIPGTKFKLMQMVFPKDHRTAMICRIAHSWGKTGPGFVLHYMPSS